MIHRESSFEAVALPFLDNLYRTAFRMVHDQRTAERFVEQAYVQACNSFHGLSEASDHRVGLFANLFHSLHNRPQAWLHIKDWLTRIPEEEHELDYSAETGDEANQNEILIALDSIPEVFREVLLLVDVEEFNNPEVQEILGIPTEEVISRLTEGRKRFHTSLNDGGRRNPPLAEDPALA